MSAPRQHFALASKIVTTKPNRKTRRFHEQRGHFAVMDHEPTAAPTSAVYRMIGVYIPFQRGGRRNVDITKVHHTL